MNNFKRHKVCKELPKIGNLEAYAEVEADGKHFYIAKEVGHWEKFRDEFDPPQPEHMKCSVCGQYWAISAHSKIFKYCFNCGAYMREAVEE